MNRKCRVVPVIPRANEQPESRKKGKAILPLKTLMRKTNNEIPPPPHVDLKEIQSNWDVVIFKITPLKDVVKHEAAYVL
jgi:hypothetical protein